MKKLFTLLFVAAAFAVSAQSFTLSCGGQAISNNDTLDVFTTPSSTLNTYIEYGNTTSESIYFKVRKEELQVVEGVQTTFCISGSCYAGNLSQELFLDENQYVSIEDENNVFHCTFYAPQTGVSLVKYTFFNTDNEADAVSVVVRYTTSTGVADVNVSNQLRAYPNPTTSSFSVEYDATGLNGARVVVRTLTGATVYAEAVQGKGKVNVNGLNLKAGVYFYGLEANGKSVVSKKLLVK